MDALLIFEEDPIDSVTAPVQNVIKDLYDFSL